MEAGRVSNIHSVTTSAAGPHRNALGCLKPKSDAPAAHLNTSGFTHTSLKLLLGQVQNKDTDEQRWKVHLFMNGTTL